MNPLSSFEIPVFGLPFSVFGKKTPPAPQSVFRPEKIFKMAAFRIFLTNSGPAGKDKGYQQSTPPYGPLAQLVEQLTLNQ
jgi:hypothetical protein